MKTSQRSHTRQGLYEVMGTSGGEVVLRTARALSASELCSAVGLSRSQAHRVLSGGRLGIGGKPLAPQSAIPAGSDVTIRLQVTRGPVPASKAAAKVLWHDRFALAAEKPAGLLVHGDGTGADTLTARVQASLSAVAANRGWEQVPTPQALHRLDKDTTGIVLFSLTEEFQPCFDSLVAGRDLHKRYLALVRGSWPHGRRRIVEPIGRDRHDARRMRVSPTGKPAHTEVACLDRCASHSLLACELGSGRRHQIRVHLAHAGHPIVGDALYGGGGGPLMLHAFETVFVHPVTGEDVCVRTAWPARFDSSMGAVSRLG